MRNILEYARTEFRSFEELPFSEVDSLILSWLSYLIFPEQLEEIETEEGLPLRELFRAEYFKQMTEGVKFPEDSLALLTAVTASPRYRKLEIFRYEQIYDEAKAAQFAAVTFQIRDGFCYIAFRGTDDSIIGWKEDFDLALKDPVPSQLMAEKYLEEITVLTDGDILVGGHSKGGNLAVYAAAMCGDDVRSHVKQVYSHDGPGFLKEVLAQEGFKLIRNRIRKTLPQSSMIGMVFEQECEYQVIRSCEKGVMQHNPFSWELEDDHFIFMEKLTPESKLVYRSMNDWIATLAQPEREVFINVIFDILDETGAQSFNDLGANLQKDIPVIARSVKNLDPETRRFMLKTIRQLAVISARNIPDVLWNESFPDFRIEIPRIRK